MDDFDIDALDNMDFDAVAKNSEIKQAEKDVKDAKEIERLRIGADECVGGCIL